MTDVAAISAQAAALLVHYSFDLGCYEPEELVALWLAEYPAHWLRLAVVEALYQGRYKAVSVEHILAIWQRRNQPLYHFNHDFERLVCSHLFQDFTVEDVAAPQPEEVVLPPAEAMAEVVVYADVEEAEAMAEEDDYLIPPDVEELSSDRLSEVVEEYDRPPGLAVKHTDFYSKLRSVAQEGRRQQERELKRQWERRRDER